MITDVFMVVEYFVRKEDKYAWAILGCIIFNLTSQSILTFLQHRKNNRRRQLKEVRGKGKRRSFAVQSFARSAKVSLASRSFARRATLPTYYYPRNARTASVRLDAYEARGECLARGQPEPEGKGRGRFCNAKISLPCARGWYSSSSLFLERSSNSWQS